MHKRLWIVSLVVFVSLCGLALLGLHSIGLHAEGLQDRRNAEFTEVAEQIRIDIKRKLDAFIIAEQSRPYTDYQPYYIPETVGQSEAILPSPLADKLSHNLAFGHFQIEADGTIITPFSDDKDGFARNDRAQTYITNIESNLLNALNGNGPTSSHLNVQRISYDMDRTADKEDMMQTSLSKSAKQQKGSASQAQLMKERRSSRSKKRIENYEIQSLQSQKPKVISQRRSNVAMNIDNTARVSQQRQRARSQKAETQMGESEQMMDMMPGMMMEQMDQSGMDSRGREASSAQREVEQIDSEAKEQDQLAANTHSQQKIAADKPSDTVQIRIEPFIPKVVAGANEKSAIFPGLILLLRHVQIED